MRKVNRFFLFLAQVLLALHGFGNDPAIETKLRSYAGFKDIKNYAPETYNALEQNWGILQDRRGVIYVANQGGILEYDGVCWRQILIPHSAVRSMAIAPNNVIYAGGRSEIGFLEPDTNGELHYISLMNRLEKDRPVFYDVYQVFCAADSVWFRTANLLLRLHDGEFDCCETGEFKTLFKWNDKFYVQKKGVGLMQVVETSFKPVPGGQIFADKTISLADIYGKDNRKLLIGTWRNGFFIYDGVNAVPFPTEIDEYVKERLYYGARLSSGDFAIGTSGAGLAVIDANGKLLGIFNKDSGMKDNNVKYIFEDFTGNLWLALNNGIAKIDYASPISFFDDRSGLEGLVLSVVSHDKRLYAGTSSGLYYLESPASGIPGAFKPVADISGYCRWLLSTGDYLLAATAPNGVFQLANSGSPQKLSAVGAYALATSRKFPGRIWVGDMEGLKALYREKGQWQIEPGFLIEHFGFWSIVEDDAGNVWLGTLTQGVVKVEFKGNIREYRIISYGNADGLPEGEVHVARVGGRVLFATTKGLFCFKEKGNRFVPDPLLGKEFSDGSRNVFRLVEDQNKHIWFHSNNMNLHAAPDRGGGDAYTFADGPFNRFPYTQVNAIYPDGKVIWFAGNGGLIRYDTALEKKDYRRTFNTLIRRVTTGNGAVIYGGFKNEDNFKLGFNILEYKDRNLHFEAAAPFFDDEAKTKFRYYMEEYDQWSEWAMDSVKNYTNLDAGSYTLHVQAKNVYGVEILQDTFSFRVLPPWYRTWWMFLIYVALLVSMIYLIVKWRSRKLIMEKQRLECIVEDRTREINQANVRLKEMDKIKSRFFANISHEFRTPLTLIMGPLDQIRSEHGETGLKKRIDLVYRNAQRLLGLINQLLDLSKLESGKMKLQAVQRDLVPFLKAIMEPFRLVASRQRLNLVFRPGAESILVYFDPEKLEKIVCNLLSNAIKFTPAGGNITVLATLSSGSGEKSETSPVANGLVTILVKDTGVGIPGDQLVHLFERFYQAEATIEHHRKGSGIGLALTRELVELHHGVITVLSKVGENSGSEFDVRLPLGKEHLRPEEMAGEDRPAPVEDEEYAALESETFETAGDVVCPVDENREIEHITQAVVGPPEKNIVLVVEDSADLRYYIRTALEPAFIVEEAGDGKEGIEKAKAIIPDLIISDIMMPGLDGYELCRIIKNDISTSHVPVVLLTAKASEENIIMGFETGADDYITKPFNTRLLCARIKNLIELRRQLQLNVNREMVLQPSSMGISKLDREFLDDLQQVIEKHLSNPDLNVEDLSKRLYMSRTTLYRKILALSGEPPTDFIRTCRLKKAAHLLKSNFGSITEVAFEVGFNSRAYFTKCFKEKFHRLPSDYFSSESASS